MCSTSDLTAASFMTKKNGRTNLTPFTEVLNKVFLAWKKPDCTESGTFPRCSYGKTTCLPSTGLLMSHSPDVLCWQPWQKALNLFIHTCLILSPHSTSQPVGLGRWMSETKAMRRSGSGLSLNLNNSITHCSRHLRGHLNQGVWDRCGKNSWQSMHTFPAVDATHGNKYNSLLSLCLELALVYLVVKRKKEESFFKNSW